MIPKYIQGYDLSKKIGSEWESELRIAIEAKKISIHGEFKQFLSCVIDTESVSRYFLDNYGYDPLNKEDSIIYRETDYISKELALLNRAAKEFWSTADLDDRNTCPENDVVADWLYKNGMPNKEKAKQAASIIRPENAPKGPPPK